MPDPIHKVPPETVLHLPVSARGHDICNSFGLVIASAVTLEIANTLVMVINQYRGAENV